MIEAMTTTLFRPVGPEELELIRRSGFRTFPPRLPEQPIFYPVLSEEYAIKIARDWNVRASGAGYVTRFEIGTSFLAGYKVQTAGSSALLEYWIPAEDLDADQPIAAEGTVRKERGRRCRSRTLQPAALSGTAGGRTDGRARHAVCA